MPAPQGGLVEAAEANAEDLKRRDRRDMAKYVQYSACLAKVRALGVDSVQAEVDEMEKNLRLRGLISAGVADGAGSGGA